VEEIEGSSLESQVEDWRYSLERLLGRGGGQARFAGEFGELEKKSS